MVEFDVEFNIKVPTVTLSVSSRYLIKFYTEIDAESDLKVVDMVA